MRVANRLQGLAQSEIRRMTRECERVGGINLGQGICDLPTPPLVRDGAIAAIRENRSTYSFAEGARELRDAIARKLARDNGLQADPAREICVTVGASGAYTAAIHALLDPGDGILLFEPYYGYHLNAAVVAGLIAEFATLRFPEFTLREEALEAAITSRTRAVVVVSHQPTLGRAAALILTGAESDWKFKKSAIWWFEQHEDEEDATVALRAVVSPASL